MAVFTLLTTQIEESEKVPSHETQNNEERCSDALRQCKLVESKEAGSGFSPAQLKEKVERWMKVQIYRFG